MKCVEASGTPWEIGAKTGEALREEIREHLQLFPPRFTKQDWAARAPRFIKTLEHSLPNVLEELRGTAERARLSFDLILQLNVPMYAHDLVDEGCTNVVFAGGPDGPVWGKNNDASHHQMQRPHCISIVCRNDAIPTAIFTFGGMLATTDMMNAEGVAVGHSSVGNIFQQSDYFVPTRSWAYECMLYSTSTREFVTRFASLPARGKGYSHLCVDASGVMCSIEAPCPLFQVRWPLPGARAMNCVNYYQLPALQNADRRSPEGKENAKARRRFIDEYCNRVSSCSLDEMKALLKHHGDPSICRHGPKDQATTEYSMIGLPGSRNLLYLDGLPCRSEFKELEL